MPDALPPLDPPTLLTEAHDGSAFTCGEPVLDEWLRKRAFSNQQAAASRTYVVCPSGARTVIGYAALSMGQILAQETVGSMRRNMPKFIPAVMLGRLAIHTSWQGRGVGSALLADTIARARRASREVAARLIIVHTISTEAEAFYMHHGFTRLTAEPPTFALDLVKLEPLGSNPS